MRKAGDTSSDPVAIRKACDAYARKYIDIQRGQFKRLGVLGDWDNPYLTLNKEYEADELRLFADIVEKGFVYRGKKPVYWSIPARTALAEAEVEYHDHVSQSMYVKFPRSRTPNTLSSSSGPPRPGRCRRTSRSRTTPACNMSQVTVGGENYILFRDCCCHRRGKMRLAANYPDCLRALTPASLPSSNISILSAIARESFLPAINFVDSATGTGFVHIAPGHGLDDYNLGRQQGLPIYSPVDDDGCFAYTNDLPREQQMPAEMVGKSILEKHGKSDANEAVLHELRAAPRAVAPGKLSSQLSVLLAQQNRHHLPRDGPVVHQD